MKAKLAALKTKLGPLWWYTLLVMVFSQVGNVVNFYIGTFLVMDSVSKELLGAILPLTQLATFIVIPLIIVTHTFMKFVNVFHTSGQPGKIKSMLRDMMIFSSVLSLIIVPILMVQVSFIQERLKFDDPQIIWLVAAIGIASCWSPAVVTATHGIMNFRRIILTRVLGPITRLVVMLLLLKSMQLAGYLYGNLAALLAVIIFLSIGLRKYFHRDLAYTSYKEDRPEIIRYMIPIAIITIFSGLQLAVEPWVIRQRLSVDDSAAYFLISRFGTIPMYLANAIGVIIFPLASKKHENGEKTQKMLLQALSFVIVVGGAASVALFLLGPKLLALKPAWATYIPYARLLFPLGMISTLTCVFQVYSSHENAVRRFDYLKFTVPIIALEVILLYGLNMWHKLKQFMDDRLWQDISNYAAQNLDFSVTVMLVARLLIFACILISLIQRRKDSAGTVPA